MKISSIHQYLHSLNDPKIEKIIGKNMAITNYPFIKMPKFNKTKKPTNYEESPQSPKVYGNTTLNMHEKTET